MARPWHEVSDALWRDVIETNLTGVWNTVSVAAPHLIRAGGGAIVVVGSVAGHKGQPWMVPYCAAKHGLTGIVKSMALELAKHDVRINSVSPTGVDTPMATALTKTIGELAGSEPALGAVFMNTLSVEVLDPLDVSNAVLFLASDAARYVTGADLAVDAGNSIR
jgi:NAD(P)-dependent dehydrogenase (short-subunit alcohol dehydrogenase family)